MPFIFLAAGGMYCAANQLHWGWFAAWAVAFVLDFFIGGHDGDADGGLVA